MREEEIQRETGRIDSIESVRRKASVAQNLEKLQLMFRMENEDPLIRQAYEELEDEDRIRNGLPPLRRAPPGVLRLIPKAKKKGNNLTKYSLDRVGGSGKTEKNRD